MKTYKVIINDHCSNIECDEVSHIEATGITMFFKDGNVSAIIPKHATIILTDVSIHKSTREIIQD